MQVPLEIAFHHTESSDWAEAEIRDRVADLEKICERLTSCRVRVDQRASNASGTIPPVVHIELGIPGRPDVVVSHEPEHLMRKYQRPDLHKAINEAFRIAERQLVAIKEQRDGRTKGVHHDGAEPGARPGRRDRSRRRIRFPADQGRRPALLPPQRDAVGKLRRPAARPRGVLRRRHGRHRPDRQQGPREERRTQRRWR